VLVTASRLIQATLKQAVKRVSSHAWPLRWLLADGIPRDDDPAHSLESRPTILANARFTGTVPVGLPTSIS
jgi:hypothetical protein